MISSRRIMGLMGLCAVLCLAPLWAAGGRMNPRLKPPRAPRQQKQKSSQDANAVIDPKIVDQRVTKLNESINWVTDFEQAKQQAMSQNKPIFWLHALGDIEGKT
jgi:hypothetical protein